MKPSRLFLLSFAFLLFSGSVLAEDRFFRVTAKKGDSAEKLLQRFELKKQCNLDKFFQINKLKKGAFLLSGKKYYLPILIYDYNGISIRSTLGISGWNQALRIKKYNARMKSLGLRKKTLLDSNILWVPYHEIGCNKDSDSSQNNAPLVETSKKEKESTKEDPSSAESSSALLASQTTVSGHRKFPIFGEKYANIPLLDSKLAGKIFYLVSGHGGPDPGALGTYKKKRLCEDEYAYDVALRLSRNLLQHGATVYMVIRDPNDGLRDEEILPCDQDEYCWGNKAIPLNQKSRLRQRVNAINDLYAGNLSKGFKDQTVVSIHIDSRSQSAKTDVFFYHFPNSRSSQKLAHNMHQTLKKEYSKARKNRGYHGTVSGRDLYLLRYTQPRAVFIELGNIRNSNDQKRIVYKSNRQILADWLYAGLIHK